jgi:hypothetical protein
MKEGKVVAIKLTTGEEIVCMVRKVEENDNGSFCICIQDPLKVESMDIRRKNGQFKVRFVPWFLTTEERDFDIDTNNILAITKVDNEEIMQNYVRYFRKISGTLDGKPLKMTDANTSIGYLGSVKSFQKRLEDVYKLDYKPNE